MDSWDYYFDNNERYQMDMLADEYRMVLRKAHKSISVLKGKVELVKPGGLPRDGVVIEDTRSYD